MTVLVIGIQGREISCKRGLRKGDPLSPLIFVLIANEFQHMIGKCWEESLIKGLGCRDDTNVFINLYYVDETLIFEKECQ